MGHLSTWSSTTSPEEQIVCPLRSVQEYYQELQEFEWTPSCGESGHNNGVERHEIVTKSVPAQMA